MLKKFSILGLVLLIAGSTCLWWMLTGMRKQQQEVAFYKLKCRANANNYLNEYREWANLPSEKQTSPPPISDEYELSKTNDNLRQEQRERLMADMDKLAIAEIVSDAFTDLLYGNNWQQQVKKHSKWSELKELALTGSIVCGGIGGVILAWCLLLATARLIIKTVSYACKFFANLYKKVRGIEQRERTDTCSEELKEESKTNQDQIRPLGEQSRLSRILAGSGWHNFNMGFVADQKEPGRRDNAVSMKCRSGTADPENNTQSISVLLSDKESVESDLPVVYTRGHKQESKRHLNKHENREGAEFHNTGQDHIQTEDSLRTQTENLEKQIEKFKQTAQDIQQVTVEQSQPINAALQELSQQITAIREYASQQQDKVEKLQDGYDWNIIRTFCLKIIRCIDNLDARISRLKEQDIVTEQLEEVRDELIFALESSGVEQYRPQINSDYKGQEKYAEAIRDRQSTDDSTKVDKIADVIRAGYQYFINEETIKVVRTAQVKLFG
jgi:molecular chaperone GrpE (heat shock protein)